MMTPNTKATERFLAARIRGDEPLITPDAAKVLRGMLRMTLQRAANASTVDRRAIEKFEKGERMLSPRNRLRLQCVFEAAGADIFSGQGTIFVHLNGRALIEHGERIPSLRGLPTGAEFLETRERRGLSQNDLYKISGVPACRISAIENCRPKKFFLADQVDATNAMGRIRPSERLRRMLDDRRWSFGCYLK